MADTRFLKEPYGYPVGSGYIGFVSWLNRMVIFSTETEYLEYIERN